MIDLQRLRAQVYRSSRGFETYVYNIASQRRARDIRFEYNMAESKEDIKQPEPRDLGKTGSFDLTEDDDDKGFFTLEGAPEADGFDRVSHSSEEVKGVSPRSNTPPVGFSASPYMHYQVSRNIRGRNATTGQQSRSAASNMPAREQASETPSEAYLITHSEELRKH